MNAYILNPDGTTRRVGVEEWSLWFEMSQDRFIAHYERDGFEVSTVFIGLDHRVGKGPPLLFETMLFSGGESMDCERYPTKDDALIGHERHVRALNKKFDAAREIAMAQLSPKLRE